MSPSPQRSFSVIVPTRDRPAPLERCLDSLRDQDFPSDRFEIIVVDDGGSASLGPILDRFNDGPSLRVLRLESQGPAAARNAGSARAEGTHLAFLDDDCRAEPDWLKALDRAFESAPQCPLLGGTIENTSTSPFAQTSELILAVVLRHFEPRPGSFYFFRSANLAAAADDFRRLGPFDPTFRTAEDRDLSDRWLVGGGHLLGVPDARVEHHNRESLGGFCRQHLAYGAGASHFHRTRAARSGGPGVGAEAVGFYLRVFREALGSGRPLSTLPILMLWQILNLLGFVTERLHPRTTRAVAQEPS